MKNFHAMFIYNKMLLVDLFLWFLHSNLRPYMRTETNYR